LNFRENVDQLEMPPKTKQSDSLKQKNLKAFFTKGSTSGTTQVTKPTLFKTPNVKTSVAERGGRNKDATLSQASSSPLFPKTPVSDSSDIRVDLTSAVPPSSVLSSRRASSPPTSDIIDMDMFASDDEDQPVMKTVNIIIFPINCNTNSKMFRADRNEKS
jgi:DNA mismatch repair protein MSH6